MPAHLTALPEGYIRREESHKERDRLRIAKTLKPQHMRDVLQESRPHLRQKESSITQTGRVNKSSSIQACVHTGGSGFKSPKALFRVNSREKGGSGPRCWLAFRGLPVDSHRQLRARDLLRISPRSEKQIHGIWLWLRRNGHQTRIGDSCLPYSGLGLQPTLTVPRKLR